MQLQQPHVATYEPPVAVVKTEPKLPAGFRNLILKRTVIPVSYTHLDVYKRQGWTRRTESRISNGT